MTSTRDRRTSAGLSEPIPLRPIAAPNTAASTRIALPPASPLPPVPVPGLDRGADTTQSPLSTDEPVQSTDPHGLRFGPGNDGDVAAVAALDPMTRDNSLSLRSAAKLRDPSYASVSASAGGRSVSEDTAEASEPLRGFNRRRSRDESEATTTSTKRSSRPSEELGSLMAVGGLEARFGTTESALLSDIGGSKLAEDEEEEGEEADDIASLLDFSDADDEDNPPDNSPYAQVRASVAPTDNTSLSINTPRMWALSIMFSFLGSSTNLFFSLRYPSVAITPVIALLLVHPLGLLWDFFFKRGDDPPEEFLDGVRRKHPSAGPRVAEHPHILPWEQRGRLDRVRLWLAQGRWNEKEHSCVYVSSNVSFGFAFATDVVVEQTQFYKQEASIVYQLLLTLSTQILGYTFAGLTRRFLVRPSGMIWPGTLMSAAMFTTLHKEVNKEANGWRISRWKFFYAVWLVAFLFYFLPGLLMPALGYFNVVTWFAPNNVVVANLFGVVSGLGLFPMTFDWAQVTYIGSPLLTPFWAAMNVIGGLVVVMWIIAPVSYYSNWLYSAYMPILSAAVFDNTGRVYDVSKVLTKDFLFDKEAYSSYSRVFLPITYVLSYGVQFAGLAALLTHTVCWHGRDIWTQWKRSLNEGGGEQKTAYQPVSDGDDRPSLRQREGSTSRVHATQSSLSSENLMGREDVHNRLMKRYKDAPMLWYLLTFVSMTAIGIFVVE